MEATLEELSKEPLSANIILGGGIALKHYNDFRMTQDIDAWWREGRDPETLERIHEALKRVGAVSGYTIEHRQFGVTDSFEFRRQEGGRKEFSFQISVRDVSLEAPLVSAWPPLLIETLRDNIGSKMNALVNRGAPRDFVDIYRAIQDGLIGEAECWQLWQEKNSAASVEQAKRQVLAHLTRLEARRPLFMIPEEAERQGAEKLRTWFKETFLR